MLLLMAIFRECHFIIERINGSETFFPIHLSFKNSFYLLDLLNGLCTHHKRKFPAIDNFGMRDVVPV